MTNHTMCVLLCATSFALPTLPANAATVNGDYVFTIMSQARAIPSSEAYTDTVLLEDGSVATIVRNIGNTTGIPHKIRIINPDGTIAREIVAPSSSFIFGNGAQQGLSMNEAGQIIVAAANAIDQRRQLLLIEPDNTVRVLIDSPAIQPSGVPDATLTTFSDIKINEAGDVAVSGAGRLADGTPLTRVVKVSDTSSGAPSFAILDEATPPGTPPEDASNPGINVAIDNAGTVAWWRRAGDRSEVILSDGQTERVGLFSESPFSGQRIQYDVSALTNSGMLAVTANAGSGATPSVGTSNVTDGLTNEDYNPAFTTRGRANAWDANQFGQVVAVDGGLGVGADTRLSIDGSELLAVQEDSIGPFLLDLNGNSVFGANNGQFLNDAGQIVFETRGFIEQDAPGLERGTYNLVVRADPIGATPDHPILPANEDGPVTSVSYELVNALGVTRPIYVDPDPAEIFEYSLDSGPLITSLLIPDQDLGEEDGLFEILFGGFSESLAFGEVLDFTNFAGFESGLSAFSITGIDLGSGVTTDDPFVVGLTHASLGTVDLTITGRAATIAPVPLPASGLLVLSGLAFILMGRRREI